MSPRFYATAFRTRRADGFGAPHPLRQPRRQQLRPHRPAEVVALHLVAPLLPQQLHVRLGLDAFRGDREPERVPERDDRGRDRRVVGIGGDLANEGAVDLQRVQREVLEVAERRVAGAEVVHREVQTHGAERVEQCRSPSFWWFTSTVSVSSRPR